MLLSKNINFLKKNFPVADFHKCKNLDEADKFFRKVEKQRENLPFEIDGIVISFDDQNLRDRLGHTARSPRFACAFKFAAETSETTIENIILQIGRTGVVTPVAILTPVLLAGSIVARATLHNADEIDRLDARIGSRVLARKAGDIIPEIIKIIQNPPDSTPFAFPTTCPTCSHTLTHEDVAYRCENWDCPSALRRRIEHFASKKCANIEGLGTEVVDLLVKRNLVQNYSDIFTLSHNDLLALPLFKDKKADKLLAQIEKARKTPLEKLIFGLGIRNIGAQVARDIVNHKF